MPRSTRPEFPAPDLITTTDALAALCDDAPRFDAAFLQLKALVRTHFETEAALLADAAERDDHAAEAEEFEYLADEVLARLPAHIQAFLLQTSILERFNPEIAAAVSGNTNATTIMIAERASDFMLVNRSQLRGAA